MEVTGWDSVIYTFEQPRSVFRRVLDAVLVRWPNALVLDDPKAGCIATQTLGDNQLPRERADWIVLRDQAMHRHMDEHAYALMPDGDGPFGLLVRKRCTVEFQCESLAELQVTDEKPRVGKIDPYPAWLCSPVVFEVSVVTPGDPVKHPFCAWACRVVREACKGSG
jgi:hypothetical protein